ncbi:MAG: hypothetical protein D3911_10625, partial [Candidatus Electrothrix sp. AW3_4]|nr:hypothetical protein [Candidatus Electrothrix gigas]
MTQRILMKNRHYLSNLMLLLQFVGSVLILFCSSSFGASLCDDNYVELDGRFGMKVCEDDLVVKTSNHLHYGIMPRKDNYTYQDLFAKTQMLQPQVGIIDFGKIFQGGAVTAETKLSITEKLNHFGGDSEYLLYTDIFERLSKPAAYNYSTVAAIIINALTKDYGSSSGSPYKKFSTKIKDTVNNIELLFIRADQALTVIEIVFQVFDDIIQTDSQNEELKLLADQIATFYDPVNQLAGILDTFFGTQGQVTLPRSQRAFRGEQTAINAFAARLRKLGGNVNYNELKEITAWTAGSPAIRKIVYQAVLEAILKPFMYDGKIQVNGQLLSVIDFVHIIIRDNTETQLSLENRKIAEKFLVSALLSSIPKSLDYVQSKGGLTGIFLILQENISDLEKYKKALEAINSHSISTNDIVYYSYLLVETAMDLFTPEELLEFGENKS